MGFESPHVGMDKGSTPGWLLPHPHLIDWRDDVNTITRNMFTRD